MTSKFDTAVSRVLSEQEKMPWYLRAADALPDWVATGDQRPGKKMTPWKGFKTGVNAASYAIPGTAGVKLALGAKKAHSAYKAADKAKTAVDKAKKVGSAAKQGWKKATDTATKRGYAQPKPGEKGFKAWARREGGKDAGAAINKQFITAPAATGLGGLAAELPAPDTGDTYFKPQQPALSTVADKTGLTKHVIEPVLNKTIDTAVPVVAPVAKKAGDLAGKAVQKWYEWEPLKK